MQAAPNQALQTSVAAALLGTTLTLLPVSILTFLLTGEWQRAERTAWLALVLLPMTLLLRRHLQRGHQRQVLFAMSLLIWAGLSVLIFNGGTVVSPVLPVLLSLSVVGALAQDRLLAWLLPLLCAFSTVAATVLERHDLLPHNLAPSTLGLALGGLLAMGFLALLSQISSRHLARLHQQDQQNSARLQQLSAQLQLAIEAGSITCFSLEAERLSLNVGHSASRLLQCAEGEHPLNQLDAFSPDDRQRIAQAAQQALVDGDFPSFNCQLQNGAGGGRWYRLFAARSDDQEPHLICALQDIHEQKQAEQAKEHFTAMVSHELRTPLTALLGALRLLHGLHNQSLPESAQELLQLAIRGGDRLASLVNDILDYFKLQAGRMPMACQLQPLRPVLDQSLDSVHALLQERELTLAFDDCDDNIQAYLDSQRAQQVLINLLANAIKFSPPASQLRLHMQSFAEHVRFSLRDSGPGIAEEFRPHIFEPFTQADMSNTRDSNSTGLGLSISRQLMRQMGGELSYSSPPGQGATFYADFLRQAPSAHEA